MKVPHKSVNLYFFCPLRADDYLCPRKINSLRQNTLQKNAIWIAFAATTLVVLFFIQSGWVYFKTNDDIGIMYRVMGEWFVSAPTPYTLFMHFDWSSFLILLYHSIPNVPWYPLMLMLGVGVFNFILLYYLLNRFGFRGGLIYLLYFFAGGYLLFVELQFTITATCWAAVGLTLLARGIKLKSRRYLVVLGMMLFWIGLMVRFNAGIMMLAFALPLFLYFGFRQRRKRKIAYGAMFVLGLLVVSLGLTMRNNYAYDDHSSWSHFLDQNKFRAEIHDWNALSHLDTKTRNEVLREIGWSQNDRALFDQWYFWDQEKFNIDNYRAIVDQSSSVRTLSKSIPHSWIKSLLRPYFYGVFLSVLLIFFSSKQKRRERTLLILSLSGTLGLLLFFVLFLKPAPERVSYGLMAATLLLTAAFSRPKEFTKKPRAFKALVVLAIIVGVINGFDLKRKVNAAEKKRHQITLLHETLVEYGNPTLLIWGGRFPWKGIDPFGRNELDKASEALLLGALQQTPPIRKQAAFLGIEDPIKALISKDNVFLLLRTSDLKKDQKLLTIYCQEHFNETIGWESVEHIGDFTLVKALVLSAGVISQNASVYPSRKDRGATQ